MDSALIVLLIVCIGGIVFLLFKKDDKTGERLRQIQEMSFNPAEALEREEENNRKNARFKNVRVPDKLKAAVMTAGLPLRSEEFTMIWISAIILPALIVYTVTSNFLISIAAIAAGAVLPLLYLKIMKKRRQDLFGVQLGDALMLISNGLRAGFSFEQVLETVSKELPDPISSEFSRVTRELKMGMTLESSLTSMTERMENTDLRLLTSAVLIQRQVGGNLADILDTISVTIQDRIRIKNNIKALSAQGRISGLIVGAIPIVLFLALSTINPEYMQMFYESLLGKIMLVVAVIMEVVGFIVIRKMIKIDV